MGKRTSQTDIFTNALAQILFVLGYLFSSLTLAQQVVPEAPIHTGKDVPIRPELQDPMVPGEVVSKGTKQGPYPEELRKTKFLSLTLGIEFDDVMGPLPQNVNLKGDYRKVTAVTVVDKKSGLLRFRPTKEGVATLTLHDKSGKIVAEYRIDVKKSDLDKIVREIRSLIGEIEGIQIKIINNKVVVDGQIILPKDMSRIGNVISQYPDKAISLVSMSPIAQKKIAEIIEREINNPEVSVRAVNDRFLIEGQVSDAKEEARVLSIAKTFTPDAIVDPAEEKFIRKRAVKEVIINLLTIKPPSAPPPPKIIQVVIHYVELGKNYGKVFNFNWSPTLADNSSLTFGNTNSEGGSSTTITGVIQNLIPKLNWLTTHDHGRILQSASLIVEDTKKGEIRSTQKLPYQGFKDGAVLTLFEEVGLVTSVTPSTMGDRSDSISLDLNFEISSFITEGVASTKSLISTKVIVRSGQSAAVGGLIKSKTSHDYNRAPSNISESIISLHASKNYTKNQSQFVIFVTPIIKSSASAGSDKVKQKFRLNE